MPFDVPAIHAPYVHPNQPDVVSLDTGKILRGGKNKMYFVQNNQASVGDILTGDLGGTISKNRLISHQGIPSANGVRTPVGHKKTPERLSGSREKSPRSVMERVITQIHREVTDQVRRIFVPVHLHQVEGRSNNGGLKYEAYKKSSYTFSPQFGPTVDGVTPVTFHFATETDRRQAEEMLGYEMRGVVNYVDEKGETCQLPYVIQISYTDSKPEIVRLHRKYVKMKKVQKSRGDWRVVPRGHTTGSIQVNEYDENRKKYSRAEQERMRREELQQYLDLKLEEEEEINEREAYKARIREEDMNIWYQEVRADDIMEGDNGYYREDDYENERRDEDQGPTDNDWLKNEEIIYVKKSNEAIVEEAEEEIFRYEVDLEEKNNV